MSGRADFRVDISEPLQALCDRLSLEYSSVAELRLRPREVVATVYRLRDGHKYIGDDGEVATDDRVFLVTT